MKSSKFVSGILIGIGVMASLFVASPTFAASQTSQACVDGTDRTNLSATLGDRGSVTVGTVGNKPLCDNLTLNFSSYSLPDGYNGQGFVNNSTAIPQTQFANTTVSFTKGSTDPITVKVPTPDACKPTQIDLYYGANQTSITTSEGLVGTDAIVGKIYNGTGTCATTSVQKTTPPTVTTTVATPPELPSTGINNIAGGLAVVVLAGGTYAAVRLFRYARG